MTAVTPRSKTKKKMKSCSSGRIGGMVLFVLVCVAVLMIMQSRQDLRANDYYPYTLSAALSLLQQDGGMIINGDGGDCNEAVSTNIRKAAAAAAAATNTDATDTVTDTDTTKPTLLKLPVFDPVVIPEDVEILNVDVGFNVGSITNEWLGEYKTKMFVVGVEAHPKVAMCAKSLIDAQYDDICGGYESRFFLEHLRKYPNQYDVIHAAAGSSDDGNAFIELWTGGTNQHGNEMSLGEASTRTDIKVYSKRSESTGHKMKVPLMTLSELFQVLPLPTTTTTTATTQKQQLKWGCLKTDIQGADVPALLSSNELIRNFACISMEHWGKQVMKDKYIDPVPFLLKHGFIRVSNPPNYLVGAEDPGSPTRGLGQTSLTFINVDRLDTFNDLKDYKFCVVGDAKEPHEAYQATIELYNTKGL